MSDNEGPANRMVTACASCKHQRKRCHEGCVMAPHFPQSMTEEFQAVHKTFGIANVMKAIKALDLEQQGRAIKSFIWEAKAWDKDPIHGPYGEVQRLQEMIKLLEEDRHQKEDMIRNISQQVFLPMENGVSNSGDGYGTLTNSDFYAVQERGFIQDVRPSNFDCRYGSFGNGQQGRIANQGREGILGQNNCSSGSSDVFPRGGERVRAFGDDNGVMQYAASRNSLVDYARSRQHVRITNQNNFLPPGVDQPDQVNVEIRGRLNPKEESR